MSSRYRVEVRRPSEPLNKSAVIGVFADDYENAVRAGSALFKAYPEAQVCILDGEGVDPPEYLVSVLSYDLREASEVKFRAALDSPFSFSRG